MNISQALLIVGVAGSVVACGSTDTQPISPTPTAVASTPPAGSSSAEPAPPDAPNAKGPVEAAVALAAAIGSRDTPTVASLLPQEEDCEAVFEALSPGQPAPSAEVCTGLIAELTKDIDLLLTQFPKGYRPSGGELAEPQPAPGMTAVMVQPEEGSPGSPQLLMMVKSPRGFVALVVKPRAETP